MICLYHHDADGCAAAAVVQLVHSTQDIIFEAVQYGQYPPDVTGEDVIIVDFSYPREILLQMHRQAKSLLVLDHHKSAQEVLADLVFAYFDLKKSGAVLAWEHFFPGKPIPVFLQYIQDRDLWKFELPDSKAVSLGLRIYPLAIGLYLALLGRGQGGIEALKEEGFILLRYQEQQIKSILANGFDLIEIAGYKVPCINHTDSNTVSEVCGRLSEGYPFAACYFDTADGKRVFSLRSREDGIDVSEIAKQYGGGGHAHAAGFFVPKPTVSILSSEEKELLCPALNFQRLREK